jgi:hypothetical protein
VVTDQPIEDGGQDAGVPAGAAIELNPHHRGEKQS